MGRWGGGGGGGGGHWGNSLHTLGSQAGSEGGSQSSGLTSGAGRWAQQLQLSICHGQLLLVCTCSAWSSSTGLLTGHMLSGLNWRAHSSYGHNGQQPRCSTVRVPVVGVQQGGRVGRHWQLQRFTDSMAPTGQGLQGGHTKVTQQQTKAGAPGVCSAALPVVRSPGAGGSGGLSWLRTGQGTGRSRSNSGNAPSMIPPAEVSNSCSTFQ